MKSRMSTKLAKLIKLKKDIQENSEKAGCTDRNLTTQYGIVNTLSGLNQNCLNTVPGSDFTKYI